MWDLLRRCWPLITQGKLCNPQSHWQPWMPPPSHRLTQKSWMTSWWFSFYALTTPSPYDRKLDSFILLSPMTRSKKDTKDSSWVFANILGLEQYYFLLWKYPVQALTPWGRKATSSNLVPATLTYRTNSKVFDSRIFPSATLNPPGPSSSRPWRIPGFSCTITKKQTQAFSCS